MERIIICDTETTGMPARDKHRIIEIAAVEIIDRQITGKYYNQYINPQREIDPEAIAVHGITNDMVADKPLFKEIMPDFLKFIEGATFVAHNSEFDEEFLNMEMIEYANSSKTLWEHLDKVVDSMKLSKRIYGNKGRHSLDALLDRLEIDRSERTKHGALIDCQLLAKAYLKMTEGLDLSGPSLEDDIPRRPIRFLDSNQIGSSIILHANPKEMAEHIAYLDKLEEKNKTIPVARRLKV